MNGRIPALAVGLLLVTAGCVGDVTPLDGGDSEPGVAALVTDMDADDAREVVANHRATLADAISYQGRYQRGVNGDLTYQRRVRVNWTDRRFVNEWRNVSRVSGVVFVNASGTYERWRADGDSSFTYDARIGDAARFTVRSPFASAVPLPDPAVLARYDFEYVRSDDDLHYFEAASLVDSASEGDGQADARWAPANVTDVRAQLVVHEAGYVRSFDSEVTVERGANRTVTFGRETTVAFLNNTDVEVPHWIDRAA